MYKVEECVARRAASRRAGQFLVGLSRKILLPAWIGLAVVSARSQALPPPNDDFLNAQALVGTSGTVHGTTVGATAEDGEYPHSAAGATNSIWYVWTAPDYGYYTFNTRGSTDLVGNDLNTALGIYSGASVDTLIPVAAASNTGNPNDEDPSGGPTSRVTFLAFPGTTYYIAVDSGVNPETTGPAPAGNVVVNWKGAPSSGTFQFASDIVAFNPVYAPGTSVNVPPVGAAMPSRALAGDWPYDMSYVSGEFDQFKRITVTRNGAARGRCSVDVVIDSAVYTNHFFTNYFGTNISVITFDTNSTPPVLIGFTNTYMTNFFITNIYQDNLWGNLFYNTNLIGRLVTVGLTNTGGLRTNGGKPVVTDYTCGTYPANLCDTLGVNNFTLSNSVVTNGLVTFSITNAFCELVEGTNYIDSVTGAVLADPTIRDFPLYLSTNGYSNSITVWFDDGQMSADIPGAQNPWGSDLADTLRFANFGEFPPGGLGYTNINELTTAPNPFFGGSGFYLRAFAGKSLNGNAFQGVNRTYVISLANAALDPVESPEVAPPEISTQYGNAGLNIVSTTYATPRDQRECTRETVFNFTDTEFYAGRSNPQEGGLINYLLGVTRSGNLSGGASVSIRLNWVNSECGTGHFHTFPLNAGSEYASPSGTNADISNTTLDLGTVSWGDGEGGTKRVPGTINPSVHNRVQFNEDVRLQLFNGTGSVPAYLGNINEANFTILFNDEPYRQQPAGAVDRTHNRDFATNSYPPFNAVPGANKTVYAVAVQGDGKSVIAGDFTAYDTLPLNRIARMDTNGIPDDTFNPGDGANDFIAAVSIDSSSRILIGGGFTAFNGKSRYHIARLNQNGAIDNSFATGFGANATVWAIAQQTDGKILIGGEFTTYDATNRNFIARLNTDGSLDTTFNPPTGPNDTVFAIAVQTDGKVVIGGQFTQVNGVARGHIARLNADGTLDTSFNPGTGTDDNVYAIAQQSDGKILVGGGFGQFNLTSQNGLVRLNNNGSRDTTFNVGQGVDGTVYAIALLPSDNALIGGNFTTYDTVRRFGIARLLLDGALDTSFLDTAYNQFAGLPNHYYSLSAINGPDVDPWYIYNTRNFVFAIAPENYGNTNIMIGGGFARVGGGFRRDDVRNRMNVARLVGGATPGPGNIYLARDTYTVDENSSRLFVDIVRTNGQLGPVLFFFTTNSATTGPGAAGAADFSIVPNAISSGQVGAYDTYYNKSQGQHPCSSILCPTGEDYGWMLSDAYTGTSQAPEPECPASTTPQIYLGINDNSLVDGNRSATLRLTAVDGNQLLQLGGQYIPLGVAFGRSSASMTIVDNDYYAGTFGFSQALYTVNRSAGTVTVTVLRTNASSGSVVLNFTTVNGTALNTIDYVKTNGSLTFGPNVTSRSFSVRILGSATAQPDKTFGVQLSFASNPGGYGNFDPATLPTNAVVKIIDNTFSPGHLSFSQAVFTNGETAGNALISVTRTGGSVGAVSVDFAATAGTAVDGVNFVKTNGTLIWNNGDISTKKFLVPLIHDGVITGPLTVNLALTNAFLVADPDNPGKTNILGSYSNAVLSIVDEDAAGTVQFVTPNFNVLESSTAVRITVARTGGVSGPATINYATTNLGPTNDPIFAQPLTNYSPASGQLNFAPGEFSKTFDVFLINNGFQNPDKIFGVVLFDGTPSTITSNALTFARVTIIDDESQHTPPGQVDTTYVNPGFNDFVLATALQPDGKLIAGGNFTTVNNYVRSHIARINVDGSVDTDFGNNLSLADGNVRAVLSQVPNANNTISNSYINGPIVVAGSFDIVNNVFRHKIARLNIDGSLDTTFNPGAGADGVVYALAQTFGGNNEERKVLAVGAFGGFNGVPASGIVQLNDDGSVDRNFNTGVGVSGVDGIIYAVAVQADKKIIIGGDFTMFNGVPHGHLARLNPDGSLDNTFNPDTGTNGSVRAIAIQPDGKIVVGGMFSAVNGTSSPHIARLNIDGSVDSSFNIGVGANDSVLTLAIDSQGRILAGGDFTSASGVTRFRLTRLASDGTVDPSINFGAGANSFIATISLQTDDQIIIGGGFTSFDNIAQGHIARLAGGSVRGDGAITFSAADYVVNENGTNAVITLRRVGGTESSLLPPTSIDFITVDGSAVAGVDYVGVTNTVLFPRGETFANVSVPIIDNTLVDGDRTVQLVLLHKTGDLAYGPQPFATLTIINDDSGVSFGAAQYRVAENTPAGAALIPVVRSGSTVGTMSVDVATVGGTALPLINYVPTTNTLVFAPGESNKLFRVQILNDGLVDGDQTVDLQLSNPLGGVLISPNLATLTIAESSFGPGSLTFSQTNYSAVESSGIALVTIQRTNGSTGPVSVTLSTGDGTAVAGVDYQPTNIIVNFADGEITKDVAIRIIEHATVQPDKTFTVNLSNPLGGAVLASTSAIVTILDDHMNFTFSSPAYFVRQDAGTMIVTVVRNSGTNGTVTVDYATTNAPATNGVALAGEDYTATSGTLTFAPGETVKNIFIPILDDHQIGLDEQFSIALSNPGPNSFLGAPSVATVTILNVHSGLSFSSPTYVVTEGPQTNALITVNRSAINTGAVSVNFFTSDGTPGAAGRYTPTNGTLNFANGQATAFFLVPIHDDNEVNGDQTVNLTLLNPSAGATIVQSNAQLTIQDNDIGLHFSSPTYSVLKSNVSVTITVERTTVTNQPVTVDFATKDGTATNGVQYYATNGTLSFLPGEVTKTFNVTILNNNTNFITGDKNFSVSLSNPGTNGVIVYPGIATVNIVEVYGSLVIPAGSALLSESGPVNGIIDPNETVSMYFAFRNTGGGNTTNLVATLLNTNGVINATAAAPFGAANATSYGTLIENGASVSRQFTFTANATSGQTIVATFLLQDVGSGHQLGTQTFTFGVGSQTFSFTNNQPITILDSTSPPTKASVYPSQINVQNVVGNVAKVTATFVGLNHSYPDDIDALLVGPTTGAGAPDTLLMAAVGGPFNLSNVRLTFDDSYPALPNEAPITTGTNHPTLGTAASEPSFYPTFPTNAPPGPYPVSMGVFNGINPNGLWSLYIVDSTTLDSGSMTGGWILNVTTGSHLDQNVDLGVSITNSPVPATVSNVVVYHVDFTNYGPAGATNIVVTDALPTGMTYLSNNCDCAFSQTTNGLRFPLAVLLKDQHAYFDIYVRADVVGSFTNTVIVTSDNPDLNVPNNSASVVTAVNTPSADLAAQIAISPNPVLVNNNVTITMTAINNGFSPATGVMLTNQLPAGLSLQSVSSSVGTAVITTNTTGLIVAALGNLAVNPNPATSPTVTIVATATNAVTSLVTVKIGSSTFDPLKGNNTASAKVEVDAPPISFAVQQNGLLLSWPAAAGNLVVEQATSLAPPAVWTPVTDSSAVLVNGQYQVQVSSSNSARFFRLRAQ